MIKTKSLKYEPDSKTNDYMDKKIQEKMNQVTKLRNKILNCENEIDELN